MALQGFDHEQLKGDWSSSELKDFAGEAFNGWTIAPVLIAALAHLPDAQETLTKWQEGELGDGEDIDDADLEEGSELGEADFEEGAEAGEGAESETSVEKSVDVDEFEDFAS